MQTTRVVAIWLLAAGASSAQPQLQLVGRTEGDDIRVVKAAGGYAFAGGIHVGLHVVDVSDPATPSRVATVPLNSDVIDLEYLDPLLYIATQTDGLLVYLVSDPTNPIFLGDRTEATNIVQLQRVQDKLYVLDMLDDLFVYEITPTIPQLIGTLNIDDGCNAREMYVDGTDVYFDRGCVVCEIDYCYELKELRRIDASNPMVPVLDPTFSLAGHPTFGQLHVADNVLYAPLNSTTPSFALPGLTSMGALPSCGFGFFAQGNGLVVPSIYDVNYIVGGATLASIPIFGLGAEGDRDGDIVFRAADDHGFQMIDIADPLQLQLVGTWVTPENGNSIVAMEDAVYYMGRELYAIDITTQSPYEVRGIGSHLVTRHGVLDETRKLLFVYHLQGNIVQAYDLSDPLQPVALASVKPVSARSLQLRNNLLYVAEQPDGLRIFDVSDPATALVEIGTAPQGTAEDIAFYGNLAYVSDEDDCFIYDISDPTNPINLGSFLYHEYIRINEMTVAFDHLFLTTQYGGVNVYSLADPMNPVLVHDNLPGIGASAAGLDLEGDYLAVMSSGFHLYDVRDPANPIVLISQFSVLGGTEVDLRGDEVHIAGSDYWRYRLDMVTSAPNPTVSSLRLELRSNPARHRAVFSYRSPTSGPISFRLHDAAGRLVRAWDLHAAGNSGGLLEWDGRDSHGVMAARGVYLLSAESGGRTASERVVWMR